MRRLSAGLFCLLAVSCNCGGTTDRVHPQLEVNPLTLDFGELPIGTSAELAVGLTSLGSAA